MFSEVSSPSYSAASGSPPSSGTFGSTRSFWTSLDTLTASPVPYETIDTEQSPSSSSSESSYGEVLPSHRRTYSMQRFAYHSYPHANNLPTTIPMWLIPPLELPELKSSSLSYMRTFRCDEDLYAFWFNDIDLL